MIPTKKSDGKSRRIRRAQGRDGAAKLFRRCHTFSRPAEVEEEGEAGHLDSRGGPSHISGRRCFPPTGCALKLARGATAGSWHGRAVQIGPGGKARRTFLAEHPREPGSLPERLRKAPDREPP